MWSSAKFLKRCQFLKDHVASLPFDQGDRVARGFADLGFEEFFVLPAQKIVSLMTGKVTTIGDAERQHLFLVPQVEQMVVLLHERGVDLFSICTEDQRSWMVKYQLGKNPCQEGIAAVSIEDALLELLIDSSRNSAGV